MRAIFFSLLVIACKDKSVPLPDTGTEPVVVATTSTLIVVDAAPEAEAKRAWARAFLWRIDGTPPSFLFGTIHLPDVRLRSLPDDAEAEFVKANVLSTEIAIDGKTELAFSKAAMLPTGKDLKTVIPVKLFERTRDTFAQKGFPFEPMTHAKPWFVAVEVSMLDHLLELANGTPLDKVLYARASALGKGLEPLETVEEQIAVFDGLTTTEQVRVLEQSLDEREKSKKEGRDPIVDLVNVYLTGDAALAEAELNRQYDPKNALDVKLMKRLLLDRNVRMAERLQKRLGKGKSYFVAVGAAHLLGEGSVVSLLTKAGIKVERVP